MPYAIALIVLTLLVSWIFGIPGNVAFWIIIGIIAVGFVVLLVITVRSTNRAAKAYRAIAANKPAKHDWQPHRADPGLFAAYNEFDSGSPQHPLDFAALGAVASESTTWVEKRERRGDHTHVETWTIDEIVCCTIDGRTYLGFAHEHDVRTLVVTTRLPRDRPYLRVTLEDEITKPMADLQLESLQFNDKFYIECENERFAYDVLNPQVMHLLRAGPFGLLTVGSAVSVIAREASEDLGIDGPLFDAMAQLLAEIVRHTPSFVWSA